MGELSALKSEIQKIADKLMAQQASKAKAEAVRAEEKALHDKNHADLTDTIGAVDQALRLLSEAKSNITSSAATFYISAEKALEVVKHKTIQEQRRAVDRLLKDVDNEVPVPAAEDVAGPVPAAGMRGAAVKKYSFKSNDLIEVFKKLKESFEDKLRKLEADETAALNSFELMTADMGNTFIAEGILSDKKKARQASSETILAGAEATLKTERDLLAVNTKTLSQLTASCGEKAEAWKERSELRRQEKEAIKVAKTVLEKVAGIKVKEASVLQRTSYAINSKTGSRSPSFLQVRGMLDPATRVIKLLRTQERRTHSTDLETLVLAVKARSDGPFDKIIQMIQKMISRLLKEQIEENNHKDWCDQEIAKTSDKKDTKKSKVDAQSLDLKSLEAGVSMLAEDISNADLSVSKTSEQIAELTRSCQADRAENKKSIEEARDAQKALGQATTVLENFYKKSGMLPGSLLQAPVELSEEPSTWDTSYTGLADPTKPAGIISILKELSIKFQEMETVTQRDDVEGQKTCQADLDAFTVQKAADLKESEVKKQAKQRKVDAIVDVTQSREMFQKGLVDAEHYLELLDNTCGEGKDGTSYASRKEARSAEIAGLRDAQEILSGILPGDIPKESKGPGDADVPIPDF